MKHRVKVGLVVLMATLIGPVGAACQQRAQVGAVRDAVLQRFKGEKMYWTSTVDVRSIVWKAWNRFVVEADTSEGFDTGEGHECVVEKVDGEWRVVSMKQTWIA
ncbi:hypothetical protein BH11ARM2_BH11ARM2_37490 [soil metagenome]